MPDISVILHPKKLLQRDAQRCVLEKRSKRRCKPVLEQKKLLLGTLPLKRG
jgi:hypothetical protein